MAEQAPTVSESETSGATRPRAPLARKLAWRAALLAAIPLAGLGAVVLNVNARALEQGNRELHLAVADDVARAIEAELDRSAEALAAVALALTSDRPEDVRIALAGALLGANDAVDHAAIYDRDGKLIDVLREGADTPEAPETLDAALLTRAEGRGFALGAAAPAGSLPRVLAVAPIRANEELTGFVASRVSLAALNVRVRRIAQRTFDGRSNSVFVVDQALRALAHPDESFARALASMASEPALAALDRPTFESNFMTSGEHGSATHEARVATVVAVPRAQWAIVVQSPTAIVYASLARMRLFVIGATLASIVAAALAAVQMARHLTRPLDTLAAFARKLAARKFEERVELHTDDELAVLAHAMSNAAADLQASEARIAREVAIRTDLGRYLPAQVVERVVAREQAMALGGERRDVTIMFADIVGFTPMSAKLSPEAVVELLNELFTIMTEIVFRHGGTVDKFIGDCVMAFWGAPAVDPEHASKALEAARDMLRFLDIGNARWRKKLGIEIELAIGVHTGPAVIGNIGSEVRMEYTAIGETVNLAARLEGLARPRQILLSRATVDAADATDATFLSSHTLQGIPVPVDVFTLEP